ncbi:hypothetical protein LTS18_001592, partial [Coniosporium uncinatum]
PQSAAAYRAEQAAHPRVRVFSQTPFVLGGQQVSQAPVNAFFNPRHGFIHEPRSAATHQHHDQVDNKANELRSIFTNTLPKSQIILRDNGIRHSHALEIKDPRTLQKPELNPRSPNFEPGKPVASLGPVAQFEVPSPSLIASPPRPSSVVQQRFPWFFDGEQKGVLNSEQLHREQRNDDGDDRKDRSSDSVSTADFFPNNPQDHSFTKHQWSIVPSTDFGIQWPATQHYARERLANERVQRRPCQPCQQRVFPPSSPYVAGRHALVFMEL